MRVGFLLTFIHVSSVLRASEYGCASAWDVQNANPRNFADDIKGNVNQNWLLQYLNQFSTRVRKGTSLFMKTHLGKTNDYALRVNKPFEPWKQISVIREIIFSKYLCGAKTDRTFNELIPCEEKAITPFNGCVEDKGNVYILQRPVRFTLGNEIAIDIYRGLKPMDRFAVILKTLDKLIDLHDKGIIHSDIRPESIASRYIGLEEIELVNLDSAGVIGSNFFGGTFAFLPPEFYPNNKERKLSPKLDIYSIAMTIVFLEMDISTEYNKIDDTCFEDQLTEECHKKVLAMVSEAFGKHKGVLPIKEIILQALSYKQGERQASVKELSEQLVRLIAEIGKTPEYQCYFDALASEEEYYPSLNPPLTEIFTWKEFARSLGLVVKTTSNSQSIGAIICCTDNRKSIASKAKKLQQQKQLTPEQKQQREEQKRLQLLKIRQQLLKMDLKMLKLQHRYQQKELVLDNNKQLTALQAVHDLEFLDLTAMKNNYERKKKALLAQQKRETESLVSIIKEELTELGNQANGSLDDPEQDELFKNIVSADSIDIFHEIEAEEAQKIKIKQTYPDFQQKGDTQDFKGQSEEESVQGFEEQSSKKFVQGSKGQSSKQFVQRSKGQSSEQFVQGFEEQINQNSNRNKFYRNSLEKIVEDSKENNSENSNKEIPFFLI